MTGIDPIGHMAGIGRVLALRSRILEQSQTLSGIAGATGVTGAAPTAQPGVAAAQPGFAATQPGFAATMQSAIDAVNGMQTQAANISASWERGETQDIASVMIARQKAGVAFEATLQARNRLLSAYRDIMNMPV